MTSPLQASGPARRSSVNASARSQEITRRTPKNSRREWIVLALESAEKQGLDLGEARTISGRLFDEIRHELELTAPDALGRDLQITRLVAVIALHWLKRLKLQTTFETVALTLKTGLIGGRRVAANPLAESVVVEAVSQRDAVAITYFSVKYAPIMNRCVRSSSGARAEQELEGLVGEIFEHPERFLDGYRGSSELSVWLYRVARSAWINATRLQAREGRRLASLPIRTAYKDIDETSFEDYLGCQTTLVEIARQAVEVLSERENLMMRMIVLDGLTQVEFAGVIGRDKATITRWMTTARERLQRRVNELLAASGREIVLREYLELAQNALPDDRPDLCQSAVHQLNGLFLV